MPVKPNRTTLHVPKKADAVAAAKGPNQNKPKFQASIGQPGVKQLAAALSKR